MILAIECAVLCALFTVIVICGKLKNPLSGLHNLPTDIQQRVRELPEYAGKIGDITTSALYAVYERWCSENEMEPCSHKDFSGGMKDVQSQYGIEWSKHIERGLRGFKGICFTERS